MSFTKKFIKLLNDNVLLITTAGIVVGIHWMIYKLQSNPDLIPEDERKELPIIKGARYLKEKAVLEIENVRSLLTSESKSGGPQDS